MSERCPDWVASNLQVRIVAHTDFAQSKQFELAAVGSRSRYGRHYLRSESIEARLNPVTQAAADIRFPTPQLLFVRFSVFSFQLSAFGFQLSVFSFLWRMSQPLDRRTIRLPIIETSYPGSGHPIIKRRIYDIVGDGCVG